MTDTDLINARAVTGDNAPDFAAIEADRLAQDYADLDPKITALLDEARDLPSPITDRDVALRTGAVIKRMKDVDRRVEEIRNVEGEPHLRRKNAVDGFFFAQDRPAQRLVLEDRQLQMIEDDVVRRVARLPQFLQHHLALALQLGLFESRVGEDVADHGSRCRLGDWRFSRPRPDDCNRSAWAASSSPFDVA